MPPTWKSLSLINATLIFSFASPLRLIGTTPKISEAIAQTKINQVSLDRSTNLQRETVHQFDSSQFKVAARVTLIPTSTSPVQLQKKLQIYQEALATYREKGDRTGEANTLNQIGTVYTNLKEHSKALEFHQQALAIYKEIGDRTGEANTLNQIGTVYTNLKEHSKALEFYQQAWVAYKELRNLVGQRYTLIQIGEAYLDLNQLAQAQQFFQQALVISKTLGCQREFVEEYISCLIMIGKIYLKLNLFSQAQTNFNQALDVGKKIDYYSEIYALKKLGEVYLRFHCIHESRKLFKKRIIITINNNNIKDEELVKLIISIRKIYLEANQYYQFSELLKQVLVNYRVSGDRTGEQNLLIGIRKTYLSLNQPSQAQVFFKQILAFYKAIPAHESEANIFNQIGAIYLELKQYRQALNLHQQALTIYRQIGDRKGEAETFGYIGNVYFEAGQYRQVEELFRQQLESLRLIGDKEGEKILLNVMGYYLSEEWGINAALNIASGKNIQERLREGSLSWQKVLEISKLTLFIIKQRNNSKESCLRYAQTLHGIGWAYRNLGHYAQALDFYQQALKCQEYGEQNQLINQLTKPLLLIDIGTVYIDLAQYDLALENLRKSCSFNLKQPCYSSALARIGFVYKKLGQYDVAFQYLQEALTLSHTQYDKQILLNYIGEFYAEIGEYSKALKFYNDALKSSISGEQSARGFILNNIALIHLQTGNNTQALETYQQALALFRELDDRPGQRLTLSNIGLLLEKQNQPGLAIVFYKEAVNITQTIRQGLRELTLKEQEVYTKTIANTYRSLANLLLSQGRLLEAQQVLELLKIQEIRDFTRNAQVGEQLSGIALSQIEEKIIKEHGSLVSFGQKLADCQKTQCAQKEQLIAQRTFLTQAYNQAVRTLESEIAARKNRDSDFLNPRNDLNRKAQEIIKAQPGTLLIYPFVLEDKLWLLMASEGEIVKKFEVEVGQQELGETVLKFRQLLSKPSTSIDEIKQTSQKLYNWLIKPLESELKSNKQRPIKHLVFALDRVTRYIPMSALFDGKQYLVENYAISTIVSAGFTDTIDRLPSGTQNVSVLALGLSREVPPDFDALKNVPVELDAIVKTRDRDSQGIYPGLKFLNQEFDFNTIQNNLYDRNILHIATHGEFVPGSVEASYLLLGTGEKLAIPQIENLNNLGNVHLVVLSACETALGGPGNDGIEIAGISHYFLARGAKSVLSSLWKVNDASTSYLMQQFYQNLAKSTSTVPVSKAEALRQAQIALITKNFSVVSAPRGEDAQIDVISTQTGLPAGVSNNLSHPYYWAPFILIGNAL